MMSEISKLEKFPQGKSPEKVGIKEELKKEFEEIPRRIREYLKNEGWGGVSDLPLKDTKDSKGEDLEAAKHRRERKSFEINVHLKSVKEIAKKRPEIADLLIEDLKNRIEEVAGIRRKIETPPDWELGEFLMEKFKEEFPGAEKTKEIEK